MEKIVMATSNPHKVIELGEILAPYTKGKYTLVSMKEAGFTGEIDENGTTFEENALLKASTVSKALNCIAVADDSGLCVDRLGGRPGIYSARYGGAVSYDEKIAKLLKEMENTSYEERKAKFVSAFCCVLPDGRRICVTGECNGYIAFEKKGSGTFGYDPVFYYPEYGKTFAEMTDEEKNGISHRGKAVNQFINAFFLDKQ